MILVTGATGHVGSELVPQLLDFNQPVRVLTRDPGKLAHWKDRVEIATGSFEQPETLDAALQGVEKIFLMSSEVGAGHVEAVVQATKRANLAHIAYLSSIGAEHPAVQIGKWHHDREEAIRASGIAWTFLRPGQFMSNALMWVGSIKAQGAVYFPGGNGITAPIDPRDIATIAALSLTQPDHANQIYELTGAEKLTATEQVEILSGVLGKPLRYVDVPPPAAREGMLKSGMPAVLADAVVELFTEVREGLGAHATDTFERIAGRSPRTFEAWCRDHVTAFQ